jgi:hypothetical protein
MFRNYINDKGMPRNFCEVAWLELYEVIKMERKKYLAFGLLIVLIICTVFISGCLQEESPTKAPTTTEPPETNVISDPVVQRADPYISKIVFTL